MDSPTTLKELFDTSVKAFGDRVALQAREGEQYRRLTYREVGEKVRSLCGGMRRLGLQPGDKAALLAKNCPEWAMVYFAAACGGLILVPVDSLLKAQEIRHILHDAEVKALFASENFLSDILDVRDTLPSLQTIVVMNPTRAWEGAVPLAECLAGPTAPECSVRPDQTAVIIYTSGTTGKSKGVMLSHYNIVSNVIAAVHIIHIFENDVFLSVLPLHHTFEATGGFLAPFSCGATITYAASLKSKEIIQDIRDTGVTVMVGVPLLYEKMLNGIYDAVKKKPLLTQALFNTSLGLVRFSKTFFRMNLGRGVFAGLRKKGGLETLRLLVCGGAPMAPEIQTGFEELGIMFIQGYGTTEASPVITVNPPESAKPDSVGVALEGVDVRIDQPNENGEGEILVRGPNIMQGYYRNPAATAESIHDGWLATGDIGYLDADSYLHITGRRKNVIVTGAGKNVYPEEIELELDQSPFILESLVVPQVDPANRREFVHAIIVPDYEYLESYAEAQKLTLDDTVIDRIIGQEVKQCCDRLADYKRIKDFQIRDEEFDKTSTRKIKRYLYQQKSIELK